VVTPPPDPHSWFNAIWNIPGGIATLITGCLAIAAAVLAWFGIRAQISSNERIEAIRATAELKALETAFTAELLCFATSLIESTNMWNRRLLIPSTSTVRAVVPVSAWPRFPEPKVYEALIGKIGLLSKGWPAGAIVGFYTNLLELNAMSTEAVNGQLTVNQNALTIAARIRLMALNLAQALDGLNNDRGFPIPQEIVLHDLQNPRGVPVDQVATPPATIQQLLECLGGEGGNP
jgi:hypothetical protein